MPVAIPTSHVETVALYQKKINRSQKVAYLKDYPAEAFSPIH
jgi:hypothetical protein